MPDGSTYDWGPASQAFWRIYHQDKFTPNATHRRLFGPLGRFDHHTAPTAAPADDPAGRTVAYAAERLTTAAVEVFDGPGEALICPNYRAAVVRLTASASFQDLRGEGSLEIGALAALGTGDVPRERSQLWARAIYEQRPVAGVVWAGAHDYGPCIVLWERAAALEVVVDGGVQQDFVLEGPELYPILEVDLPRLSIPVQQIRAADCKLCQRGTVT